MQPAVSLVAEPGLHVERNQQQHGSMVLLGGFDQFQLGQPGFG